MDEVKTVKIYTWKYDNGAWGYAVKQKNKGEWLEEESYATKREVEKCCKKYEKQPNCQSVDEKKIKIRAGLSCVSDRYEAEEESNRERNGIEAMCALLNSCGPTPDAKREMLRLVASVLAGYCARVSAGYYMGYLSSLQRRAPIISVKQATSAGEILERIIRSLALDTTASKRKKIECRYTPVLPRKASDEKITDRAFLKLEGRNKRMLPQYRDTTLMVYSWFLRGKEGKRLQQMNRWVGMVIYGPSLRQVLTTPVEIEGEDLAYSNCQWDVDEVQASVIRYARYILRKSKKKEKWEKMIRNEFFRYDKGIDSHNQNSKVKIKVAERYPISMQLLALHLFLKACVREQELEQNQAVEIEKEWYAVLLPGWEIRSTSDFVEQEDLNEENRVKEEFESALIQIFEEGFPDKFYISKEERRTDMWGDIGLAPMKEPPSGVYYARFSKEQFIDLLDKFCGGNGGKWLYDEAKKLILDYVGYSDKMRVRATGTNKKSIFFRIDKMTFLPQELRAKLDDAGHRAENAGKQKRVSPDPKV